MFVQVVVQPTDASAGFMCHESLVVSLVDAGSLAEKVWHPPAGSGDVGSLAGSGGRQIPSRSISSYYVIFTQPSKYIRIMSRPDPLHGCPIHTGRCRRGYAPRDLQRRAAPRRKASAPH
jgi:hypothetical protein